MIVVKAHWRNPHPNTNTDRPTGFLLVTHVQVTTTV